MIYFMSIKKAKKRIEDLEQELETLANARGIEIKKYLIEQFIKFKKERK